MNARGLRCKRSQVQAQGARCRWLGGGWESGKAGKAGEEWKEGGSRWTGAAGARVRVRVGVGESMGGAWRIVHSKRIGRGSQGGNRPLSCPGTFSAVSWDYVPLRQGPNRQQRAHHPRLWPVRAPDPGPSDLLSGQQQATRDYQQHGREIEKKYYLHKYSWAENTVSSREIILHPSCRDTTLSTFFL